MRSAWVALVFVFGTSAACYTTTIERAPDAERQELIDDLQVSALARDESMSRDEIEDRLGMPFASYEDGRITTYALRKIRGHFALARAGSTSTIPPDYRLVLVFQPDDRVERWSVVDRNRW